MAKITINDLEFYRDLDREALISLRGGSGHKSLIKKKNQFIKMASQASKNFNKMNKKLISMLWFTDKFIRKIEPMFVAEAKKRLAISTGGAPPHSLRQNCLRPVDKPETTLPRPSEHPHAACRML